MKRLFIKLFIALFFLTAINLNAQSTYTFTNAGKEGNTGPTQNQVNIAYSGTNLDGDVTVNTQGIQEWVVPTTGIYTIIGKGASGGYTPFAIGGQGRVITIDVSLTAGDVIEILVGQEGGRMHFRAYYYGWRYGYAGGGGGGTYIINKTTNTPILICGGGGGAATSTPYQATNLDGSNASEFDNINGQDGIESNYNWSGIGAGGTNGSGGQASSGGSGGGGYLSDGILGGFGGYQGLSYQNNGLGGENRNRFFSSFYNQVTTNVNGGFGGGAGAGTYANFEVDGGGGGGYSGGGGSGARIGAGGGGGNIYTGTFISSSLNTGHGQVIITRLGCSAPAITTQPIPQAKTYGEDASFTVVADNATGYQWQELVPLGTWDDVSNGGVYSNATTATLNITKPTVAMSGYKYRVVVSGDCDPDAISDEVLLTVEALAITGNFTADNKIYDGDNSATVLTRTLNGVLGSDDVSLTGGTATFSDEDVAPGKTVTLAGATLGGADAGNYSLTSVGTTTADITELEITGDFTADNKIYDGDNSATVLTRTLNGVLGSDDVSLTGGTATFSDEDVAPGKTVTLAGATLGGADAGNYSLTSVGTTTADITELEITGDFTADNKIYDGDNSATVLTRTLNGVLGSDDVSLTGGTATFSDEDVAPGKTVTLAGATLGGADAGNYSLTSVGTTTADITELEITGDFTADNKIYDGDNSATVLTRTLNGVLGSDDVSLTGGTATFSDEDVAPGKTVTLAGATLGGADAGNYSLTSVGTTTADITELEITGDFTADNKIYDGDNSATVLTRTLNGVLGSDDVSLTGGTATFSDEDVAPGKTVTLAGATLGGADAGNYSLTSVGTTTADITELEITGDFTADNKIYDGDNSATVLTRTLNGVLGSDDVSLTGGTATFSDEDVAPGKTVTLAGATLGGADAGNYSLTSVGTTTADITELEITGDFTADNKIYDGDNSATVLTRTLNGVLGSDDVSLTGGTATFSDEDVAPGKTVTLAGATLGGADAGNYSLTSVGTTTADITELEITGDFTADNKIYDGDNSATVLTRTLNGVLGSDDVSLTGGTATFSDEDVAPGKTVTLAGATLGGADAGNYSLTSVGTTTADITELEITGDFTADNKIYDGDNSATVLTRTLNGVLGSDDVSLTGGTATFSDEDVAPGKTVTLAGATLGGADAGNYSLTSVGTTTADITELEITGDFTADNKIYDGDNSATVLTRTLNGVLGSDDVSLTGGTATFSDEDVAPGKTVTLAGATLGGADAGNYSLTSVGTTTADITELEITGDFTADNKIYDGDNSATVLTRTLNGVLGSDDVSLTGGTATFSDEDVAPGKTVTLAGATLGGADAGNYSLTSVGTTTADITELEITGDFTADNKIYDGDNSATVLTRTLNGVLGSDDVSLTGGTATFSDEDVAPGKTVTLAGATLGGADAGNYSLTSVGTTTADITELEITGDFTADNKIYDGDNSATVLTRTLNGVLGSDDVSLTGGTATFSDEDVAPGKTVTLAGATLGGADAGNYSLTSVGTTTADITELEITGDFTADNKIYDGDNSATVLTRTLNGVLGSDDVSLTGGTATFSDEDVAPGKTVTLAGATLGGADAGNYSLTSVGTTTADITELEITGDFTADNKIYDGDNSATVLTRTLNGVLGSDDVSLTGGTATFSDEDVAPGKTVTLAGATLGGADAGNYSLTSVGTTTADITPRDLTVTATGINKIYDGTNIATVNLSTDKVIGDDVTPSYASAAFDNPNGADVGSNKPVTVNGITISGDDADNYNLLNITATTTADITARPVGSVVAVDLTEVQYSDQVTFTATIIGGAPLNNGPKAAESATFKVGAQTMGTANFEVVGLDIVATGTYALLEGISGQMSPGVKIVTAVINNPSANFSISPVTPSTSLTILQENAVVNYIGNQLTATTNLMATIDLRVSVQDIDDSYRGDITNATVEFFIDGGSIMGPTPISALIDPYTGIISKEWTTYIARNSGSEEYTFRVKIDGYYTGEEVVPIIAYEPTGDFITGGGYIIPTASAGLYPSDEGSKTNFGFNVKFNKKGTKLKGKLNFIWRSDGRIYQAKSNATDALGVDVSDEEAMTAVFTSKCNYSDITDPLNPISLGGNKIMHVSMTDRGEPGENDDISFTLWDGNELLYSSNWSGVNSIKQLLNGGNLVVHSGFNLGSDDARVSTSGKSHVETEITELGLFEVTAWRNPSDTFFNLKVVSDSRDEFIEIIVFDINFKLVHKSKFRPQELYKFGQYLEAGAYIVKLTQGDKLQTVRVMKY